MKYTVTTLITLLLLTGRTIYIHAQCNVGENAVTVTIITDDYGYEGFWALYPAAGSCTTPLISGGNSTQVGCSGGGQKDATTGNGYGNNQTITSNQVCLTTGASYKLKYVDDWGDAGFHFYVNIDGLPVYHYTGTGSGNTWTFTVTPALSFNCGLEKITSVGYSLVGNVPIKAKIYNYGSTAINSLDVFYSIDNGIPVSQTLGGLSILPYDQKFDFVFNTQWNAIDTGTYQLKVWTGNINSSNADLNTSNDTLAKTIVIGNPVPQILDQYITTTPIVTQISSLSDGLNKPRDLDFHPTLSNYELWVVCEETEADGGSTVIYSNAGKANQTSVKKEDSNNWHFMSMPTGIAFGDNGWFATSPGIYDANHSTGHFTGPALWDPEVYTIPNGGNGSHIDMLHQSPFSMGIAWEHDLAYWDFDGNAGNIVRYDFVAPHEPGGNDHSAGIVWRYTDVSVSRINDDIPCHLVLDEQKKWLYIVDGGSTRVIRMDITTGNAVGNLTPYNEPLAEYKNYTSAIQQTVVNTGLTQPSGIDVLGNRMIVSDYSNGNIYLYDITNVPATLLATIATGQTGICGVKIGPDGLIWYVNRLQNTVSKIKGPVYSHVQTIKNEFKVAAYPNPSGCELFLSVSNYVSSVFTIKIFNLIGEEVFSQIANGNNFLVNISSLPVGNYLLQVTDGINLMNQKIYKQ